MRPGEQEGVIQGGRSRDCIFDAAETLCMILWGLSRQEETGTLVSQQCIWCILWMDSANSLLLKLLSSFCGSKTMLPFSQDIEQRIWGCQWEWTSTEQVVVHSALYGIVNCMETDCRIWRNIQIQSSGAAPCLQEMRRVMQCYGLYF